MLGQLSCTARLLQKFKGMATASVGIYTAANSLLYGAATLTLLDTLLNELSQAIKENNESSVPTILAWVATVILALGLTRSNYRSYYEVMHGHGHKTASWGKLDDMAEWLGAITKTVGTTSAASTTVAVIGGGGKIAKTIGYVVGGFSSFFNLHVNLGFLVDKKKADEGLGTAPLLSSVAVDSAAPAAAASATSNGTGSPPRASMSSSS